MKKSFLISKVLFILILAVLLQMALFQRAESFPGLFGTSIPDNAKKVLDWCKTNAATIQASMARKDVFYEKQGAPRSLYAKPFAKSNIFAFYPSSDLITRSAMYSKDFSRLYFLVTDSGYTITHLLEIPDSGEPQYIFTFNGNFRYYDISPDGKEVMFSTLNAGEKPKIMRYNIATKALTPLMNSNVDQAFPNYSPDGESIVFATNTEKTLMIYNLKTGAEKALVNDNFVKELPKYSPNGAWIVYQAWSGTAYDHFNIYRVDLSLAQVKQISHTAGLSANPSFDRTSQWVIYITTPIQDPGNRICITDLDGINTSVDPTSLPHCWFPIF